MTRYAQLPNVVSGSTDDEYNTTSKALACAVVASSKRLTPYHYVPVNVKYGPEACGESFEYVQCVTICLFVVDSKKYNTVLINYNRCDIK